ncbi:hypothetical protein HXX76_010340 [Chlamydomonas incerta]|uniref:Uncharacterized protein n=1 Tax=Chlamydomonas incerta TaxID=51695 RepID=A0A835VUW9_CHLIN|nr:hypothetical protein HXX76_010340 [Chlamydomonas incerta]|eukprot:KAG2430242.1 hypothetical protein HXX76_010340 [Chlamydomonas incerta]
MDWRGQRGCYSAGGDMRSGRALAARAAPLLVLGLALALGPSVAVAGFVEGLSASTSTAARRGLLQQSQAAAAGPPAGCFDTRPVVAYAGSGGPPDLKEVAAALPFDTGAQLLPLGARQAVLLDLEAGGPCTVGLTSLPGALLLYDNGTLDRALPRLAALRAVGGSLMLYGKAGLGDGGLKSLQPLQGVSSAKNLLIYNMDALVDLKGLEAISALPGQLILSDNARLRSLKGLDGLTSVGGDVALLSNQALTSVQGLGKLRTIGGQIVAKGNGNLRDLLPLTSLTSLGRITETNNGDGRLELPPALAARGADGAGGSAAAAAAAAAPAAGAGISGGGTRAQLDASVVLVYAGQAPDLDDVNEWLQDFMPPMDKDKIDVRPYNTRLVNMYGAAEEVKKLGVITGSLVVWSNADLGRGLWPLSGVTAVYGALVVVGATDGSSVLETLQGLDNVQYAGTVGILSLPRLKDFSGLGSLAALGGDFNVLFCPSLASSRGLGPLTSVYSDLWIQGCGSLKDLDGFKGVRNIGASLHLDQLASLSSLDGLAALESVFGEILIRKCNLLSSTSGLKSLAYVGKSVAVLWDTQLNDLSGLSRLKSVPSDVMLSGLPALTNLGQLSDLSSVGLNLVISDNTGLKDLSGLGALKRVGGLLSIANNNGLQSLKGLEGLQSVGGPVNIANNPSLPGDSAEASRIRGLAQGGGSGGGGGGAQQKKL